MAGRKAKWNITRNIFRWMEHRSKTSLCANKRIVPGRRGPGQRLRAWSASGFADVTLLPPWASLLRGSPKPGMERCSQEAGVLSRWLKQRQVSHPHTVGASGRERQWAFRLSQEACQNPYARCWPCNVNLPLWPRHGVYLLARRPMGSTAGAGRGLNFHLEARGLMGDGSDFPVGSLVSKQSATYVLCSVTITLTVH